MKIKTVRAREIIDSRGNPTIEADVILQNNIIGRASVPSGASTGKREMLELRDNDNTRYLGKGVLKAVDNVNTIINHHLTGKDVTNQTFIDELMINLDNTNNKSNLGANAILAVSLACANANATLQQKPLYQTLTNNDNFQLPVPMMNVINGGAHANNNIDIQEFMIVPVGFDSFKKALQCGCEVFHQIKQLLTKNNHTTSVGDEGGFAPNLQSTKEALDIICQSVEQANYRLNDQIYIALDCASSEFYNNQQYHLKSDNVHYSSNEMIDYLADLVDHYPIISIEDALDENDWQSWQLLTQRLGDRIQLVGDDLMTTNSQTLTQCINDNIANSILIKVNQIGTLTETQNAIHIAKKANYNTIVSHRSGETEDTFIADLAVANNCQQIKTGSTSRTDRVAKYNQLLRIEEQLKNSCYAGKQAYKQFL